MEEFLKALALIMVVEGILPFLSPDKWRDWVRQATHVPSWSLRLLGLASMLLGAGLLYVVCA
jgi:uncharacterized protein YjeT (DUF2065 family)